MKSNLMIKHLALLLKYLELPPESLSDHVNSLGSSLGIFIEFLVLGHVDICDKLIDSRTFLLLL